MRSPAVDQLLAKHLSFRRVILRVLWGLFKRQRWNHQRLLALETRVAALDAETPLDNGDYPGIEVPSEIKAQFKDGV